MSEKHRKGEKKEFIGRKGKETDQINSMVQKTKALCCLLDLPLLDGDYVNKFHSPKANAVHERNDNAGLYIPRSVFK